MGVTDVELEHSAGAHVVVLLVELHLLHLSVLWVQGTAAQEVDAVREAQLPALRVGFKVHQQGWMGAAWEQGMKGHRNVRTHTEQAPKVPTRAPSHRIQPSKRKVADFIKRTR